MTHLAHHATPLNLCRQRGAAALMTTLFLLIVVAMAVLVSLSMSGSDMSDSSSQHNSVSALFLAESGLERARQRFSSGTACTSLGVDGPHNLGQGSFTVNSGVGTNFDGVTILPVNQCRVQATGRIATSNVSRTIEGVIQDIIKVKQGNFQKITAVGGNQTVTGVGFQPKAVIFFWTRQTATGYAADESMGFGFATAAANQYSVAIESDDNVGNSNYSRIRSTGNVILMLAPNAAVGANATLNARASLVSFNADGFQINWGVNESRADIIHYIALGGGMNAFAGTFNASGGTGNQAVAGVGFQPDVVLFLNSTIASSETDTTVRNRKQFNLGMMSGAGQQWAISVCGRDNQNNPPHAANQQRTDQAIMTMNNNCTGQDSLASFVSMNAGGFTINWSNAAGNAFPIFYLALSGQHRLGSFNQPTALGNQSQAGFGFPPQELFLASFNRIAGTGIAPESEISLGAASGPLARGAIWSESRDLGTTDANMATLTTQAIRLATGPTTTEAEAGLASFDSDGFTLNWTAADATARQILYWGVGSGAPVVRWREYP